ncbi:MAG: class F sortase [Candidatus Pacebacteria bacterium]|nr:class F sortase [Candidatus Paceibacterota bacterium]
MKNKIPFRWSVFIISSVGITFFILLILVSTLTVQGFTVVKPPLLLPQNTAVGMPLRFEIPSLNINSTIEDVGLTSTGAMDVPNGPDATAWLDIGPRPGAIGTAVMDGHSGWKDNIPAVFDNLHKLKVGDKIYILDDKGNTITFVVRKFINYTPNENVSAVFGSTDGLAHLNLITCSGTWSVAKQTHSTRLVVFTDRIY